MLFPIDSVEAGIALLKGKNLSDLIFSDIQLADGMCFDIFREVAITTPIIFCTAYDQYTFDAFETNAVSYLLKPITGASVNKAIEKYHRLKSSFEPQSAAQYIEKLSEDIKYAYKKTILVEQGQNIVPLPVNDIAYLYLKNSVIEIKARNSGHYYVTSTIEEYERILDPDLFYRANRQYLINRHAIVNIEKYFSRKLIAKLAVTVPENVIISKANASEFLRWLERL